MFTCWQCVKNVTKLQTFLLARILFFGREHWNILHVCLHSIEQKHVICSQNTQQITCKTQGQYQFHWHIQNIMIIIQYMISNREWHNVTIFSVDYRTHCHVMCWLHDYAVGIAPVLYTYSKVDVNVSVFGQIYTTIRYCWKQQVIIYYMYSLFLWTCILHSRTEQLKSLKFYRVTYTCTTGVVAPQVV